MKQRLKAFNRTVELCTGNQKERILSRFFFNLTVGMTRAEQTYKRIKWEQANLQSQIYLWSRCFLFPLRQSSEHVKELIYVNYRKKLNCPSRSDICCERNYL